MGYHSNLSALKGCDKYIFTGVNPNTEIINYITSNGLGAFSYKEFAQEINKLGRPNKWIIMF